MNKASGLWEPGHLPINHLLTHHSRCPHPSVKSLWPNWNFCVVSCWTSFSSPAFSYFFFLPPILPACLPPSFPPHLTVLSLSLSLLRSASCTLLHHSLFLSVSCTPFSCFYLTVIFLLLSLAVEHFNLLVFCVIPCFPLTLPPTLGPPAASGGACRETLTAIRKVKSGVLRVWTRAPEMVIVKEKMCYGLSCFELLSIHCVYSKLPVTIEKHVTSPKWFKTKYFGSKWLYLMRLD